MTTLTAQESAPDVPEGVYPATFTNYELDDSGMYGPSVKLIWELDGQFDSKGDIKEKWQFLSLKLTPRSNLWGVVKSLGVQPVLGESYEIEAILDPLLGTKRNLLIKHIDGEKGVSAKITEILPAAAAPKAATPRKPQNTTVDPEPEICAVTGCQNVYDHFTNGGKPLCKDHTGDDL